MTMTRANVPLNLPQRYRKGLIALFGVQVAPFYKCNTVAKEGAPVVLGSDNTVSVAVPGSTSSVFGLLAQNVYDPSALGELSGYEFHNNTKARVGDTVGVVVGKGYVQTLNYTGSIAEGDKLYPGPSGVLVKTQTGDDGVAGIAEEAGENGSKYIRMRVDFSAV